MSVERPNHDGLSPDEIEAVIQARRELGPAYESALVESFTEKIERAIDARADARIEQDRRHRRSDGQRQQHQLALGITSLGTGIPITAIAGALGDGLPGVVVAWLGIAAVNVAYALSGRGRT
jgi:hypothetical protein